MPSTARNPSVAPSSAPPRAPNAAPVALLVGNPNVGKTSLFNSLTGARARVGNYPGITVERRAGRVRLPSGRDLELVDVPGTYSLSARSPEEQIAISATLGLGGFERPEVVVAVVDAGQLLRCLYLVLQLIELRVPLVLALNMVDEVEDAAPDPEALERLLGVFVVPTDGRTGKGKDILLDRVEKVLAGQAPAPRLHVRYEEGLRREIDRVAGALPEGWRASVERNRALGLWALSSIDEDDELVDVPTELRERVLEVRVSGRDFDLEIAQSRYATLDQLGAELGVGAAKKRLGATERVDRVLLHPLLGFVTFVAIMLLLFQTLFSWSDPAIGLIEDGVAWAADSLREVLPEGFLSDLLIEGVVLGVGNVIVFLPQILLLFFFTGLLEDSGYMARVAYLMDRIMRSMGLHGRAFVPMLSGFACAVPAILATRTLERRRDQLLTMLVVPLMTCSARLPVYTLIIGALFPVEKGGFPIQGTLLIGMYLFALFISLLAAWVLSRTVVKGRGVPLILELPPYRLPRLGPTLRMMTEKAMQFLQEAGTVILGATVVLWLLLSFPKLPEDAAESAAGRATTEELAQGAEAHPERAAADAHDAVGSLAEDAHEAEDAGSPLGDTAEEVLPEETRALENSYAARFSRALEPVMAPLGFDWKLTTGIFGAFAAREVFVSTLALVYGLGEVDDEAVPLRDRIRAEKRADGTPTYTPLVGLSLLVFFALACQCMSTLAVVKRETGGYRWPAFLFFYMTTLAYVASLIVYQGGRLLGF